MRRSTTSVATEASAGIGIEFVVAGPRTRRRLGALLGAELICAVLLIGGPQPAPSGPVLAVSMPVSVPVSMPAVAPALAPRTVGTADGRTTQLIDLGAPGGAQLLDRVAAEMPAATAAVTEFWGPQWPQEITVVIASSAEQFAVLAGAGPDVAATTTAQRITFSPAAVAMTDHDLRIVLRHELFHYAARAQTAADAPIWLTEGVADYVGRPHTPPVPVAADAALPTDAELASSGPLRSAAYDRAWSFASYVADTYGAPALREFYLAVGGRDVADPGDVDSAARAALGAEWSAVLSGWRQWQPA